MSNVVIGLALLWSAMVLSAELPNPALKGACTDDQVYRNATESDFAALGFNKTWVRCGFGALGYANGTTKCLLKEFPGLSESCARCFGNYSSCAATLGNCFSKCVAGASPQCKTCSIEKCGEAWTVCTGIPKNKVPQ